MFDPINVAVLLVTLLNLGLAALIIFRAARNLPNRTFGIVILLMVLWQVSIFFYRGVGPDESLLWARLLYISASLVPSTFLIFAYLFPNKRDVPVLKIIPFFLFNLLIVILTIHPTWIIQDVIDPGQGEKIILWGPFYFLYVIYIPLVFGWGYVQLFKTYLISSGKKKLQVGFVIFGTLSTTLLASLTNLVLPTFNIFALNWFGQVITVLLTASITYSIIKHRFMDIRLAVRILIFKIFVAIVLGGFFFYVTRIFSTEKIVVNDLNMAITTYVVAIVVVSLYGPLDKFMRRITNSFLFQREYSRQELLRKLNKDIAESINIHELQGRIRDTLDKAMRIERVDFHLKDQVKREGPLWDTIRARPEVIVYDELIREIDEIEDDSSIRHQKEALARDIHAVDAAVILPLTGSTEGLVGVIALGEKKGGDAFTTNDISNLEALMYQAGISIENAMLFAETQGFSRKLEVKVKQATHDLEIKNRRLSVLRRLDKIALEALNIDEMAQKIVDLVSWEMGFHGALLVLLEGSGDKKLLRSMAMSNTPNFNKIKEALPKDLTEYTIKWGLDPSNLMQKAIQDHEPQTTQDFRKIFVPPLTQDEARAMQDIGKIKFAAVYPLFAHTKPLGVIIFDLSKSHDQLNKNEHALIDAFIDEVGIAIENIQLYNQLEDKNLQLKETNEQLKELDNMKDELVSIASHELRTPMSVIRSYLWMALDERGGEMTPKLREYIDRSYVSSERMIALINDMLAASRLEGKKIALNLQPLDIRHLIQGVVSELTAMVNEKGLELKFNNPNGAFPDALMDEKRMYEIIMNLISNAVKYTQEGEIEVGVSLAKEVAPEYVLSEEQKQRKNSNDRTRKGYGIQRRLLSTASPSSYIWISVTDTGQGIAQEDLPRLFKKFGKLELGSYTKVAESGGTGLGLYITKGLVELHGGRIWVESPVPGKPKSGSRFSFSVKVGDVKPTS